MLIHCSVSYTDYNLFSVIFRVYCADHTYCTLRLPFSATAETIKIMAADKLKLRPNDELMLVEVKSTGERATFKDEDMGIPTALSLNGRVFVSPKDHLDALVGSNYSSCNACALNNSRQ